MWAAFIGFATGSAWGVSCHDRFVDWRGARSICTEWAHAGNTLAKFKDDGVDSFIPNPLRPAQIELNSQKVRDTFSEFASLARTMTEQVAGDAPNGSLTATQRYLVARLASVSLKILPAKDLLCADGSQVNARYTERTNEIQVCPLTARLPAAAWLPLFAHELGHLADPCNFRQGFAYTDRVPRSVEGIRRVVNECGVRGVAELMSDGDHRADRALALTPLSNGELRKAILKLVECGLLRSSKDPDVPASREGHPYNTELLACSEKEKTADRIGFRVMAQYLRTRPQPLAHAEWITYFYASVNCSPAEHSGTPDEYSPSAARLEAFLKIPEARRLAKCE